jgi:adenosylhomocysteine nucleosidase
MTTDIKSLLNQNTLFVFAVADEAGTAFSEERLLLTGVGKINATHMLMREINWNKPDIIVNLGSAGSKKFSRGTIVHCTQFIQRDMDATSFNFEKYKTPFSDEPILLEYGLSVPELTHAVCGTGDNTIPDASDAVVPYDIVEMEAYALALTAKREHIPFLCLKYITDGADASAGEDWAQEVHKTAQLRHAIDALKQ